MKIVSAELTIYWQKENDTFSPIDDYSIELSPMQLLTICKILGINVDQEQKNGREITHIKCNSDETLAKFFKMKSNPLKLQEIEKK